MPATPAMVNQEQQDQFDHYIDTGGGFSATDHENVTALLELLKRPTSSSVVPPAPPKAVAVASATSPSPRKSQHLVIISCKATTGMAGYVAGCLVNPGIPGVTDGNIGEIEMTERGKRALIIASVTYSVRSKKTSKKLPGELKTGLQNELEGFYRAAGLINGKVAKGKVRIEVRKHDPKVGVFDNSVFHMNRAKPLLVFTLEGAGGHGALARLIETVRMSINYDLSVIDLYGKQLGKEWSTTEILVQLEGPVSESPQKIAASVNQILAAKLPDYEVQVSSVESALNLFGRGAAKENDTSSTGVQGQ